MDFFKKYRWPALLVCLLAAGGGLLAALGGLPARNSTPAPPKDWGTCPNGTKISSWARGSSTPTDGVITEHLEQRGCWAAVKDPTGTVLYNQVIRSHRYVVVTGNGRTVTRLVDGRNPEDCKIGRPYRRCLLSTAVD
ncbi:hypothetical protein OG979_12075 [Actinomadura citrea]|uniref:hypothetical protein n=1 Tax=Actinomadura citrea TaxID=46158 RepID=UPI002E290B46|nr:hypothetical protein [Actinomadura citrea]